jgi:hypothetical protein
MDNKYLELQEKTLNFRLELPRSTITNLYSRVNVASNLI